MLQPRFASPVVHSGATARQLVGRLNRLTRNKRGRPREQRRRGGCTGAKRHMLSRAAQTCARRGAPRVAACAASSASRQRACAPRALAGAAAGLGLGWAAVLGAAPARCEAAIEDEAAAEAAAAETAVQAALAARNRAWRDALREALAHWASFLSLCLATFVATAVERVALASQVQQLVALPGQVGLDDALRHVAAIFGIKAVHLLAEAVKGLVAGRLGAALERRGRARWLAARQKAGGAEGADDAQLAAGPKLLVVDAAPRVVVEGTFGVVGAAGALRASPFQAVYFVAHEALLGQVVGAVAAALAAARDARQADDDAARAAWAAAATAGAGEPPDDAHLRATAVALGDAQLAFERAVDASQLAVLASYVVTSTCFVERRFLGADAEKYQKVMGFAGGAMQAAQEIGSCAEALGRGTDLMVKLHALEDAGAVDALAASPYFGGALGKR